MKNRSPAAVFFLSLITFGIYGLVWEVQTKNELNKQGANIPTAWLLIVPLANLYWVWKYAEGVEQVSGGKISAVLTLILMLLLSIVGLAIMQSEFNKLTPSPVASDQTPYTPPVAPVSPAPPFQGDQPPAQPLPPTPPSSQPPQPQQPVITPTNPTPPFPPATPPTV